MTARNIWRQVLRPQETMDDGTFSTMYHDRFVLVWNNCQYRCTVRLQESNAPNLWGRPKDKFRAFTSTVQQQHAEPTAYDTTWIPPDDDTPADEPLITNNYADELNKFHIIPPAPDDNEALNTSDVDAELGSSRRAKFSNRDRIDALM